MDGKAAQYKGLWGRKHPAPTPLAGKRGCACQQQPVVQPLTLSTILAQKLHYRRYLARN